jgi:hypothetical protein
MLLITAIQEALQESGTHRIPLMEFLLLLLYLMLSYLRKRSSNTREMNVELGGAWEIEQSK